MLTCYAVGADSERHSLSAPASLVLCRDADTPADSLTAVFPFMIEDELREIYLYDGEELVYSGIVDEQTAFAGDSVRTEVVSRSMAGVLLDNEAQPQIFADASAELIFRRYAEPFGITQYTGGDKTLRGEFRVAKGESCWQVLESFCKGAFAAYPRVDGSLISMDGISPKEDVVFSNDGSGIPYTDLEYNRLRCKLISRVRAKTSAGGGYTSFVEDEEALSRGIQRERYLNATLLSSSPLSKADSIIANARAKSETVTLSVPKRLTGVLGADAEVSDKAIGELRGFYITGIRYSLSDKGEVTKLTLSRKEK